MSYAFKRETVSSRRGTTIRRRNWEKSVPLELLFLSFTSIHVGKEPSIRLPRLDSSICHKNFTTFGNNSKAFLVRVIVYKKWKWTTRIEFKYELRELMVKFFLKHLLLPAGRLTRQTQTVLASHKKVKIRNGTWQQKEREIGEGTCRKRNDGKWQRPVLYSCLERKWDNVIVPPISGGLLSSLQIHSSDTRISSMRTLLRLSFSYYAFNITLILRGEQTIKANPWYFLFVIPPRDLISSRWLAKKKINLKDEI